MGIVNGEAVDQVYTNAAFIAKNNADQMPYQLDFTGSQPSSGPTVTDVQRNINSINSFVGASTNAAYNALPTWATNNRGLSTDSVFLRVKAIDTAFDVSTGHIHDGTAGNGPKLTFSNFTGTLPISQGGTGQTTASAAFSALAPASPSTGQAIVWNGTAWAASAAGGGGGGSLEWVEDGITPTTLVENHCRVYQYEPGGSQTIFALIKVPSSYQAGNPIKMKMDFYSPDSSGTALMQTIATLIRKGVDAMSTGANTRTSTNTAVTLGAGTVNIPQEVVFDLTDTTGKINAVAVSPGDYVLVELTRGTDTGASALKVPVFGAEVTIT